MIREETATVRTAMPQEMVALESVTLTTEAAGKLAEVMAQKGLAEAGLRVFVSGGGCSGLQYGMMFETAPDADDMAFVSHGMTVYVDPVSITYLQGATVAWEDSLMGGGFKIENPNATSSCGCGHSFKSDDQPAGAKAQGGGGGCGCSH